MSEDETVTIYLEEGFSPLTLNVPSSLIWVSSDLSLPSDVAITFAFVRAYPFNLLTDPNALNATLLAVRVLSLCSPSLSSMATEDDSNSYSLRIAVR